MILFNGFTESSVSMKTTVIIPNYNGMKYLKDCLTSLKEQNHVFAVIVVDNASQDGSAEYIASHFPDIRLIRSGTNEGFSAAVNKGIRAAKTPYVLLLNNDTVAEPDFVRQLELALDRRPRYFGIQAKMLRMDNKTLLDDAGDLYSALGWAFALGKGQKEERFGRFYPVFAPCAGAAIYRRDLVVALGLFDEAHFAYLEDIDLAYRARIEGYLSGFCPAARVLHAGSGSTGSRYNTFKVHLAARNSVFLIYKNMPLLQIFLNLPFLTAGFLIKFLFFVKKGFGMKYAKGLIEGVKMCRTPENRSKKVRFMMKNLKNYVVIQLELWIGMIRRITG